jgi:putative hemolysin
VRPDVKILANHLLRRVPELQDHALFVDPFGGAAATARNLGAMRGALRHLRAGGAIVVFPAGEVSALNLASGEIADPGWSPTVARLIRSSGATALPVFFAGRNSALFQCAGLIHRRSRTLLLSRELLRQRGRRVSVSIGHPIPPARIAKTTTDEELSAYLRVRTYVLGGRTRGSDALPATATPPTRHLEPIAGEGDPAAIAAEVAALPAENCLAATGDLSVFYARADQLPATLQEIGRLREISFRAVGEGSGRSRDLDRFDVRYLHLFAWNEKRRQIVGAYRLGLTDQLLAESGKAGLYTQTLFDFQDELLREIGPAIELGRSFVRPEYQKEFAPLMLLWRGIAKFVSLNPKYRRLLGPVSISANYTSLSRDILVAFLSRNAPANGLSRWVKPRNPVKGPPARSRMSNLAGFVVRSVEAVDELIGEIESDRAGMPVLLRQYLKLNAKLLGFNIDPDFGDVLDGLMLVDLLDVEPAILARYMGREALGDYYRSHGRQLPGR